MAQQKYSIWWGPPKKFATHVAERKISWLELFYDLVYVIVISRVTHYLAVHPTAIGLVDYSYMFAMTFWGLANGSFYHDVHGSPGIRTRFMTLWQMMAVGALAVTLDSPPENLVYRKTFALLFLQLFITYLWWSVGLYDKEHRKLDRPYTICYLLAFAMLVVTLVVPQPFKRMIFWIALILNFLPYGMTVRQLLKRHEEFGLSINMTERLGLLAIILFGEAILGVVNSVSHLAEQDGAVWLCFGLGILIVFALWWIFFSAVADTESKKGPWVSNLMLFVYMPMLASLGMVGAGFPALVEGLAGHRFPSSPLKLIYGLSITLFLSCVAVMGNLVTYPPGYERQKKLMQTLLVVIGMLNVMLVLLLPALHSIVYLLSVFISLLLLVVVITRVWYKEELSGSAAGKKDDAHQG